MYAFLIFSRMLHSPLNSFPFICLRINIRTLINFSCTIPVYNTVQFVNRYGMSVHLPDYMVSKTRIQQYEYSPS